MGILNTKLHSSEKARKFRDFNELFENFHNGRHYDVVLIAEDGKR